MALRETLNANFKQLQEECKINNAYLTGCVSTEKVMLNQIRGMKHSTFDEKKFTVKGNPNIVDGVIGRLSSANTTTYSLPVVTPASELIIKLSFTPNAVPSAMQKLWSCKEGGNLFITYNVNKAVSCRLTGSSDLITISFSEFNIDLDSEVEVEMRVTTSATQLTVKQGDRNFSKTATTNASFISMSGGAVGSSVTGDSAFTSGTIDLKKFSIIVDGVEVFNGNKTGVDEISNTLQIPYTLSKTGSKVVNAYYRNKVKEVYEKFGQANYYTLGENDFTLPMGEIYGMLEGKLSEVPNGYHPPILLCMWSDHLLNDISWLRADTFNWQSGDVYIAAYNELVSEYNKAIEGGMLYEGSVGFYQSPKGFKIAPASEEQDILNKYNTDGIAWYYILDTANKRFKLPRTKFGFEGLRSTVGFDIDESLPNVTGNFTSLELGYASDMSANGALYAFNGKTNGVPTGTGGTSAGIGLNASLSSSTYQDGAPVQERATQMYLYFYVGEFEQSALEQTAGITSEQLNNKVDINSAQVQAPYLKTCFVDGTSGYNIWSNGYCEQWGYMNVQGTVTFLKRFKDSSYTPMAIKNRGASSSYPLSILSYSETDMTITTNGDSAPLWWKASGYLADGEY